MPPFLPRKRLRSSSPEAGPSHPAPKSKGKAKSITTTPRKATLFDDLDAGIGPKRLEGRGKALLEKLAASDDDDSSLSSLSDDEFEDVPSAKRQKTVEDSDDEDEDIEFEDVETNPVPAPSGLPSGDLELTLTKDTRVSITNPFGTKKGPSKIERQIRISTHQVHVQLLMFHNAIRNAWCCDKELQEILVKQLPPSIRERVEKWGKRSGIVSKDSESYIGKGKSKENDTRGKKRVDASSRIDWGNSAKTLDDNMDIKGRVQQFKNLLELLQKDWKYRYRIAAPGLRKLGYMSLQTLDEESKSFRDDEHDPERHGERIRDLGEFKERAAAMEGSRDLGAQLFTALLRGLGLEVRLVANLQPVGFGWSQVEEALEKNPRKLKDPKRAAKVDPIAGDEDGSTSEGVTPQPAPKRKGKESAKKGKVAKITSKSGRKSGGRTSRGSGRKDAPIDLSDSEADDIDTEDDDSVIDMTPARKRTLPSLPYDKDLPFPHYWTEVLSPVTNTYIPVDAVVLGVVGKIEEFETRGTKAEKAKQVTAYIVGHSPDGTAKDVTTRYLKHHQWPGRTKGFRFPIEKVPVYNRRGKVARYEEKDWFKTVMSGYVRGTRKCPRTEIDDHEEATDLKRKKAEKKVVEEGKETLQYYKSSEEFVLERHLRREEALVLAAEPVKMFTVKGKGEDATEEKVFRRKDVVNCKSMETWHKEGRAPKPGEEPLKRVPYRAATTNRKRELAEAEHASGEKMLQGLYSMDQTDWIIPPPIENGIIPKNAFGNIDLYVDSMLPEGAVHIPMRGTMKICKRLGFDYAEAVTGFEFGHRMAVPIITGVVVAEENYEAVMDEWQKDEAERVRKEDEKRRKTAIFTWRKFLMGMRIIARVREEYGDADDESVDVLNPWANRRGKEADADAEAQKRIMDQRDEEMAGGFFPEGFNVEEPEEQHHRSFFPVAPESDDDEDGGGFVVEGHDDERAKPATGQAYATPQSLLSKAGKDQASEEDVEMQDADSGVAEAPAPKKRGRPPGSTKSATTKPKASAKHTLTKPEASASKSTGKRKAPVRDSAEDDEESSLSEIEIDDSEVEEPPQKATKRGATRRVTMPGKTSDTPRKTPKRSAARKSETALRSHYFEHSDDE
ncbi:Rad4-domain-containing protein [Hyaloscypha variabilis F]|uniref:Rad4-domain-containing protein n=1 Tax=Hyaloscypha variabilis (strain UAMH 11265 / GT02V1 / F) TaxID=1149755 RepID=A0A2J6RC21_HYAVF|nr:Rad4-domain-containing protein [Hyaloscypha variabilis F]